MKSSFKSQNQHSERLKESTRIIEKYPERVPIICEKLKNSRDNLPNIDKTKYLVPKELTIGQFIFVIRKRIHLAPETALFVFVNGNIPSSNSILDDVYDLNKESDGFLYISYSSENTFGF